MPKMKTHKGTAKRIKISKGGKILKRHSSRSHLRAKKSAKRKRRYQGLEKLSKADRKAIKRLLPYR